MASALVEASELAEASGAREPSGAPASGPASRQFPERQTWLTPHEVPSGTTVKLPHTGLPLAQEVVPA